MSRNALIVAFFASERGNVTATSCRPLETSTGRSAMPLKVIVTRSGALANGAKSGTKKVKIAVVAPAGLASTIAAVFARKQHVSPPAAG